VAFVPFVRGDLDGTMRILDEALGHQMAARPLAESALQRLAWIDHAFPLFETIARTHLRLGSVDAAIAATGELAALSPNDSRAWDARGQALLMAGRLEEALVAYGHGIPLGGLPVARAAYHLGWIHEQLGHRDEARSCYRLSWRIDPTVPVVAELAGFAAA
jgi:Flp pilus assembly protein TadD